jgi:hypothetical protein
MRISRMHEPQKNILAGVASQLEKPVQTVFKSFWNVLTSPVEVQPKGY